MRQAEIYRKNILAGILTEEGGDYRFCYDETYLAYEDAQPVSLTLPLANWTDSAYCIFAARSASALSALYL